MRVDEEQQQFFRNVTLYDLIEAANKEKNYTRNADWDVSIGKIFDLLIVSAVPAVLVFSLCCFLACLLIRRFDGTGRNRRNGGVEGDCSQTPSPPPTYSIACSSAHIPPPLYEDIYKQRQTSLPPPNYRNPSSLPSVDLLQVPPTKPSR
ncbi:unnamed protein product, partial [Mesorhabditis belari]|uniref:Uncharacterized protein n=1 Tax=Mesorhabditis belari TaxID=2138241 RepID=A0AAF3FFI4_9BILA